MVCLFEEELYIVAPKEATLDKIENYPLIESYFNPVVKLMVNQWWRTHFGSLPHETHKVPYADIAIEMVGSGLGVTFVFGTGWKIDEKTTKRIPVYDAHDKRVSRKVWMMLSDRCFYNQNIMDFITLIENYYNVNE